EAMHAILHLATEVRARVKPEAIVPGVQVVEPIGESAKRVVVLGHGLARLRGPEAGSLDADPSHLLARNRRRAPQEDRARSAPACLLAAEGGRAVIDRARLGVCAVDVLVDNRI